MTTRADRAFATAVRTLASRKAEDLAVLDLRGITSLTDWFVICHGTSDRQVRSLADEVLETVKKETGLPARVEGYLEADWILLDYGDFIVHVFSERARRYYDLEHLWGDAPRLDAAEVAGEDEPAGN